MRFDILLPALLACALAAPALSKETAVLGYVDMQIVLDESRMGQAAQTSLEEKFTGRREELGKEQRAIEQMQQALARDQALMSESELEKRTVEIQQRMRRFQGEAVEFRQQLADEQGRLGAEILEPAREVIAEIAREKSISAVFERNKSGLLYIDEGVDLTAEVINRLDARKD